MSDTIKLETGIKRIAIERDGEHVGEIAFDPKDVLMAERFYALYKDFSSKQKEYDEKSLELDQRKNEVDENGMPLVAEEGIAFLRETCEFFTGKIDVLFGKGTSYLLFGDALNLEVIAQFFTLLIPYFEETREKKIKQYTYTRSGKKIK